MKKRLNCLILAAVMLLAIPISAKADSTGVCFTAVGDNLLDLSSMPSFSGGSTYVPSKAFSAFEVYLNYFDSEATALLYNGSKQIFFDMNNGGAEDSIGTTYEVSAIFRGGQVYVPVAWVCSYFGLSYSYITGIGNGDVVRIKNGSEFLTDSQFLNATATLMKTYYNDYYSTITPVTPSPGVSPSPNPAEEDDDSHSGTYVFLTFMGVPDKRLLDTLDRYSYPASFFVTEQQAKDNADTLRRIYGSGHNIGIYCQSVPEESEAAADAVFGVTQVIPTIFTSAARAAEKCKAYGEEHCLSYYAATIFASGSTDNRSAIVNRLENSSGYVGLSVELSETTLKMLSSLLRYLSSESYSVVPLRETYITE